MSRENITLSIDDLVLEGIDPRDRVLFASAFSRELERLIADGGLPEPLTQGIKPSALTAIPGETAGAMGTRVARSIYTGFGSAQQRQNIGQRGGER